MNPYLARRAARVRPETRALRHGHGTRVAGLFRRKAARRRARRGLSGSDWAIDAKGQAPQNRAALEARLRGADGYAHVQDLVETDILLAPDYAAHEGGFAGGDGGNRRGRAALYHLDATRPDAPSARLVAEEVARVVRARAANPDWATGMMRHGFRGAAEVTATLDNLAAYAHLTRDVPAHLFDLYHDATLGRADLVDFMERENPAALAALRDRFAALAEAGLWITRRNSIAAMMGAAGMSEPIIQGPIIQGWCPGALAADAVGDGLVVRVRPRGGRLTPNRRAGIARPCPRTMAMA